MQLSHSVMEKVTFEKGFKGKVRKTAPDKFSVIMFYGVAREV